MREPCTTRCEPFCEPKRPTHTHTPEKILIPKILQTQPPPSPPPPKKIKQINDRKKAKTTKPQTLRGGLGFLGFLSELWEEASTWGKREKMREDCNERMKGHMSAPCTAPPLWPLPLYFPSARSRCSCCRQSGAKSCYKLPLLLCPSERPWHAGRAGAAPRVGLRRAWLAPGGDDAKQLLLRYHPFGILGHPEPSLNKGILRKVLQLHTQNRPPGRGAARASLPSSLYGSSPQLSMLSQQCYKELQPEQHGDLSCSYNGLRVRATGRLKVEELIRIHLFQCPSLVFLWRRTRKQRKGLLLLALHTDLNS